MTVEELNIKISADAENFKNEIAAANAAVSSFKEEAVSSAKAITDAFAGLIGTDVSAGAAGSESTVAAVPDDPSGRVNAVQSFAMPQSGSSAGDAAAGVQGFIAYYMQNGSATGAVNVPTLDRSETVVGAVGNTSENATPVNITTTVELDGDKVGESVSGFFMRRNRVTNGMEG